MSGGEVPDFFDAVNYTNYVTATLSIKARTVRPLCSPIRWAGSAGVRGPGGRGAEGVMRGTWKTIAPLRLLISSDVDRAKGVAACAASALALT